MRRGPSLRAVHRARILGAGEAFSEPADRVIEHFDATDEGATFFAVFLLHPGEAGELEVL